MADIVLTAQSPLKGRSITLAGCTLEEVTTSALTSFACPLEGDAAFAKRLKSEFDLARPGPSTSTTANDARAVSLTPDQVLVLHPEGTHPPSDTAAYTTDQTGNWCVLSLSGPMAMV